MGKLGGSKHLKREAAPSHWAIHRKESTWIVKPSPGAHPIHQSIPLIIAIREILGLAKTRNEAKKIISQGKVWVDGKIRRNDHFPTGLMDTISIPDLKKDYRVLPSKKGFILHSIDGEEAKFKICRIEDKKTLAKGIVQINLHDGRDLIIRVENPQNPTEDIYNTLDTVKISLPERQLIATTKMQEKDFGIITGGKNIGKYGKIVEIEKAEGKKRRSTLVTIEDEKGSRYQTVLDFVFAIGEADSAIALLEVA